MAIRIRRDLLSLSVFSPRVVGIAVARYDFSSRDTRELSLLQGDIIKIYTKISNGWWKGEVDGRVILQQIFHTALSSLSGCDLAYSCQLRP